MLLARRALAAPAGHLGDVEVERAVALDEARAPLRREAQPAVHVAEDDERHAPAAALGVRDRGREVLVAPVAAPVGPGLGAAPSRPQMSDGEAPSPAGPLCARKMTGARRGRRGALGHARDRRLLRRYAVVPPQEAPHLELLGVALAAVRPAPRDGARADDRRVERREVAAAVADVGAREQRDLLGRARRAPSAMRLRLRKTENHASWFPRIAAFGSRSALTARTTSTFSLPKSPTKSTRGRARGLERRAVRRVPLVVAVADDRHGRAEPRRPRPVRGRDEGAGPRPRREKQREHAETAHGGRALEQLASFVPVDPRPVVQKWVRRKRAPFARETRALSRIASDRDPGTAPEPAEHHERGPARGLRGPRARAWTHMDGSTAAPTAARAELAQGIDTDKCASSSASFSARASRVARLRYEGRAGSRARARRYVRFCHSTASSCCGRTACDRCSCSTARRTRSSASSATSVEGRARARAPAKPRSPRRPPGARRSRKTVPAQGAREPQSQGARGGAERQPRGRAAALRQGDLRDARDGAQADRRAARARRRLRRGSVRGERAARARARARSRARGRARPLLAPRNVPSPTALAAPRKADAQLAALSRAGAVDLVVSEDGDCLVFGCRRVLFKLESDGSGQEIQLRHLAARTRSSSAAPLDRGRRRAATGGVPSLRARAARSARAPPRPRGLYPS